VAGGCESDLRSTRITLPNSTPEEPAAPPYDEISIKAQGSRIPVIMYHDVVAVRTPESQWFDCSVDEFRAQLDFLASRGAVPISIGDLYDHLTTGKPVPEGAVVLTFDDNYQGYYDNALPILREYGYPSAMFVHTGFVGNKEGRYPKMDWDTLREIVKDPLVTIGSHTISHPDDLSKLDPEEQMRELTVSKEELERELGKPMDFFAYPNGKYDEESERLTRAAGYKMSFSIDNGLAEESPGILAVKRYVHTRLEKAWEDRERALRGGALGIFRMPLQTAEVRYENIEIDGVKLNLIYGGRPETVMSDTREGVREFIERTGAQAGINGAFFAMAAIASTDNRLIGPCKTHEMGAVVGDEERGRWNKLRNRPVMMWSDEEVAIVPFQPETMRTDAAFRDFMPEVTDVFMGGVWLIRQGVPRLRDDLMMFASSDIMDPRRRAFIGVNAAGEVVFGASNNSVTSERLAAAAAAAGVQEAVLLDSGFSTSLVLGPYILVSGHSRPTRPSRPVPHAVMMFGPVDPAGETLAAEKAQPEPVAEAPERRRRRS
jgi:peptidoglycan/xylan/chitin deacetylase (PgdA/CDA1 family)